jgi:prepilin-type N-terminal cleavage/methylation domain-containing protein
VRHDERGFSLLELMIVVMILTVVVGLLYVTLSNSTTTYTNGTRMGAIQDDARRVIDSMANEIRLADQKTLLITGPSTGPNGVTFVVPNGFAGGNVIWSTPITFQLMPSVFDPNQDSVTRSQNGTLIRLCNYTAPTGLLMVRNGNNLLITLSLTVSDESGRNTLKATVQTSVTLRNSS